MAAQYRMSQIGSESAGDSLHKLPSAFKHHVQNMAHAYPGLIGLSKHLSAGNDIAAASVESAYLKRLGRLPGRCSLLLFKDDLVESLAFEHPEAMREALLDPSLHTDTIRGRLWILEDLENTWTSTLADHLGVDPLLFSEQRNTFYFTDSNTVPSRAVPSLVRPERSFTLRYFEIRQLSDPPSVDFTRNQMTFAMNRRRYETLGRYRYCKNAEQVAPRLYQEVCVFLEQPARPKIGLGW